MVLGIDLERTVLDLYALLRSLYRLVRPVHLEVFEHLSNLKPLKNFVEVSDVAKPKLSICTALRNFSELELLAVNPEAVGKHLNRLLSVDTDAAGHRNKSHQVLE